MPADRERRAVAAAYFSVFLGAGVWLPYLPLWLAWLGFAGWQIGLLTGLQPVLRWVSALAAAYAADRWRIRRRLLVAGAAVGAACYLPLLGTRQFPTMLVVLALIGVCHGPVIPLLDATAIAHLPRLGGDYGRLRLWGSLSFIVGAVGSAPVVDRWTPAAVPWLLAAAVVALAPALRHVPAEQPQATTADRTPWRLVTPPMPAFLATTFLVHASSGAWNGFFALHTRALGLAPSVPGIAWGLAVSAEVALFRWGRPLVMRFAPARLLVAVVLLTALRWAATAVATRPVAVVALQLGHVLTFSTFHLAAQILLARLVPAHAGTAAQALYGLLGFGLGGSVGMGVAGALVAPLGTRALFAFEAVVALAAVVPAVRLARTMR